MNIYLVSFLSYLEGNGAFQGFHNLCLARFKSMGTCDPYYRVLCPCLKYCLCFLFVGLKILGLYLGASYA